MKNKIWILLLALAAASCTERIDIELDTTYQRLVVEGHITTDTGIRWVRLTKSSDYYNGQPSEGVSKAQVTLSDGYQALALAENPEKPGFYETPADFAGIPGHTYQLNIELEEEIGGYKTYEATSELRPVASIDSIQVVYNEDWEVWEVRIFAQEPTSTDFYMFQVLKNGVMINDTIDEVWVSDDKYFNGNYTNGIMVGFLMKEDPAQQVNPGDTITLKMSGITKEYYNFIFELQDQTFQYRNPLFSGPPANISTNVEHAQGFFAAYSSAYCSTIYREE